MALKNSIKVTLIRSLIGRTERQKSCIKGLALRKINQSVVVDADDPCVMGMVNKVSFLLHIEEVN